ncbi:metal-dependent hydrolase [Staphylospora marina]|uniref:metal-dependent hydrolase n=1 Tax=Staphylospora marina TaxID=2490858 RepID=UPI0013DDCF99|nr:metal-dependent hydrolase [Staphylospora marina]
MDTATHFVMGLGLFGLAQLDPAVTESVQTTQAVLLGTVVGSEIPDLDTLYRLKGKAAYIRNHRGWSHSIPMLVIWPSVITAALVSFIPGASWLHVWLWTFVAVFIHVFIDVFNVYGTQALRPFSRQWIALHTLNIFDPFIFSAHLVALFLWWFFPDRAVVIFPSLYVVITMYVIHRFLVRSRLVSLVRGQEGAPRRVTVTPTARFRTWNVIAEWPDRVKLGEIRNETLQWTGEMSTEDLGHPAVEASRQAESIRAFLSLTSYGYPRVYRRPFGYEVRWLDVRYHHKKHFPFVAVALLDHDLKPFHSFVGWMKEEQLEKKIRHLVS